MNRDFINVSDRDMESAQTICASISDSEKRNRAVANVIAAKIARDYFDSDIYNIDTETGLYNICSIVEKYDISDIYINNSYVDVRICFSEEEMCVPKSHFDNDLLPSVYMFIKLNSEISSGQVIGFVRPEEIDRSEVINDAYFISEDKIVSLYDIETRFNNQLDVADVEESILYECIDGSLDLDAEVSLLKTLTTSKRLRTKFLKIFLARTVFDFISLNEDSEQSTNEGVISDSGDLDDLFNSVESNSDYHSASDYSTNITPSGADVINSLDNDYDEHENSEDELELHLDDNDYEEAEIKESLSETESDSNTEESFEDYSEEQEINSQIAEDNSYVNEEQEAQLENLFTGEQEGIPVAKKKSSVPFLATLLVLVLAGAGVYSLYNNMTAQKVNEEKNIIQETIPEQAENTDITAIAETEDAMPDESVVNENIDSNNEVISNVSIPAIEQNLDTSVIVSNLKVDWEVPEGYVSNTSAKRYLIKLGKIIQLNLKTELLLLNKPPLTNKISVELKFNETTGKFEAESIKLSSGEKSVDSLIMQTVKSALLLNLSASTESFARLQGNPVLVIHL